MIRWLAVRRYNWIDILALSFFLIAYNDGHFWWGLALALALCGLSYAVEQAAEVDPDE